MTVHTDPQHLAGVGTRGHLTVDGSSTQPTHHATRVVPLALSPHPRLHWQPAGDAAGARCGSFEIHEVDSSDGSAWWRGDAGGVGTGVIVSRALEPFSSYRIQVSGETPSGSSWIEHYSLETGPFDLTDWSAAWIEVPPLQLVSTRFTVGDAPTSARLYVTAQGLARASLNQTVVEPGIVLPSPTDRQRALYRAFAITDLLKPGENTLDVVVAEGAWSRTGLVPRVLAELHVRYPTGSTQRVTLGPENTTLRPSRVATQEPFYLERHERDTAIAYSRSDHPQRQPTPPRLATEDLAHVVLPDPSPPTIPLARIPAVEIHRIDGTRVYDVGTNIAGRSVIRFPNDSTPGLKIRIRHGEHLAHDHRVDTTNLRLPDDHDRDRQVFEFIVEGSAGESHTPWFAYYGFRYVEIQGLTEDTAVEVSADIVHTSIPVVAQVDTDSPTVNRLMKVAERTWLNNVHGTPEDCPTREQAGWTGDAASVAEYSFANFDVEAFLTKWIADLMTSQQDDGWIPAIAPDVRSTRVPGEPVWGSALHRLLLGHWRNYADERLVESALPALRRWADYQIACRGRDGTVSESLISFGHDWLALEQTPPALLQTAATIDCLRTLAILEKELGNRIQAEVRESQAEDLRKAGRAAFVDEARFVVGNGSQGSFATGMLSGMLQGGELARAADHLERMIRARGNRISTGFAATRSLVLALASQGRNQVILDALEQPVEPGVGAMLTHGPGTFWECWWIDPTNTGTGSLDHVGLGGPFAGWVWHTLVGIQSTAPGYSRFRVAPCPVGGVGRVNAVKHTRAGTIQVSYTATRDYCDLSLTVPAGAVASVVHDEGERHLAAGEYAIRIPFTRLQSEIATPEVFTVDEQLLQPKSLDVTGSNDLLLRAVEMGTVRSASGGTPVRLLPTLRCTPVPHARPSGPVLEVAGDGTSGLSVRLDFPGSLDLSGSTFVYALVDECSDRAPFPTEPVITIHARDGKTISGTGQDWPVGWNRAYVNVSNWSGLSDVVAIEVGVRRASTTKRYELIAGTGEGATSPSVFHLGEVGFSMNNRTW